MFFCRSSISRVVFAHSLAGEISNAGRPHLLCYPQHEHEPVGAPQLRRPQAALATRAGPHRWGHLALGKTSEGGIRAEPNLRYTAAASRCRVGPRCKWCTPALPRSFPEPWFTILDSETFPLPKASFIAGPFFFSPPIADTSENTSCCLLALKSSRAFTCPKSPQIQPRLPSGPKYMAKFPSISVEIEYLAIPSSLHVAGSDLFFCLARRADTGRNITQSEVN